DHARGRARERERAALREPDRRRRAELAGLDQLGDVLGPVEQRAAGGGIREPEARSIDADQPNLEAIEDLDPKPERRAGARAREQQDRSTSLVSPLGPAERAPVGEPGLAPAARSCDP